MTKCETCGELFKNALGLAMHKNKIHRIKEERALHKKISGAPTPGTGKVPARRTKKSGFLGSAPATFTLDEAVELLAAVIAQRVTAAIESRIDSVGASKFAASAAKLATSEPLNREPLNAEPSSLADLDSDLLRIKAGVAKERGDLKTWGQCMNILKRRERAAASIERESKETEA